MSIVTAVRQPVPTRSAAAPADYWALTKPDINFLIGIVTAAGFCLGLPVERRGFPFLLLIHTLLGTLLVSSGASALNQYRERRFDARMRRTARRPLAAGKLDPLSALRFGLLLSLTGAIYLAVAVNMLASLLTAVTLVTYLFVYTPLKRKTPWCTLAGAFPGAMIAGVGPVYRVSACIVSAVYVYFSGRLAVERTNRAAKRLLIVSICYLPLAFCLIFASSLFGPGN